jgi:copper homeostasis protein
MNTWSSEKPLAVEVVATSIESCLVAEKAGASRIELCSALSTAGLTPSSGLLQVAKQMVRIPVFVLIRPREGHFVYTTAEKMVMLRDIENALLMGADGIVTGALLPDQSLDAEFMEQVLKICSSIPVTFHRAFDAVNNPTATIHQLIQLGVSRVLTSGGAATCVEGKAQLMQWITESAGQLTWVAGKGLTPGNVKEVYDRHLREYHLSGHSVVPSTITEHPLFDFKYSESNFSAVEAVVNTLRQLDL